MQIKYQKKLVVSLKLHAKNISIFFPHHLNVVKMNLTEFLGLMLFFLIFMTTNFNRIITFTEYKIDTYFPIK